MHSDALKCTRIHSESLRFIPFQLDSLIFNIPSNTLDMAKYIMVKYLTAKTFNFKAQVSLFDMENFRLIFFRALTS